MIRIDAIYLAVGASDLRAGMDTLLGRVVQQIQGGAQMHCAYVFANRSATRLKVLVYDGAGLWLCARRLQSGRFIWPQAGASATGAGARDASAMSVTISRAQWDWFIAGAPWQHLSASAAIKVV